MVLVFKRATYTYYVESRAAAEDRPVSMIGTVKIFNNKKIQCEKIKFYLHDFQSTLHIPHLNYSVVGTMLHFQLINLFFFLKGSLFAPIIFINFRGFPSM